MRVILFAIVLATISLVLHAPSDADEIQPDKLRDLIAETAEKLSNDDLSPDEKADVINRLRELLNRQSPPRERGEARPGDWPDRDREMDRQRQQQIFERLEQARREFDEAIRNLESLPPRQGLVGPPPGERRGQASDGRGDQPGRRDAGPRDQRDGQPMEPPRMPDRPLGNFPFMQPPRFSIGIAFLPKESELGVGIVVDRVMERSPAAEAGLRNNDVIIAANDRELREPQQLAELVQRAGQEGRDIRLKIRRADEMLDLTLRPQLSPEQNFPPGLGSISVWEMIPGQPPVMRNQLPPGLTPFVTGQQEHEMEQLRRRMETMQRQIDQLREQVNQRSENPTPPRRAIPREQAEPREPKTDRTSEDI